MRTQPEFATGRVMARRSSLWTELRREREQRQRQTRQAYRVHEQLIRQAEKEYDQAVRGAARAEAAERKRQEQLAHEARSAEAAARTAEVEAQADELRELLRSSLSVQTSILFEALKRGDEAAHFDPGVLGQDVSLPVWEDLEPLKPASCRGWSAGGSGTSRSAPLRGNGSSRRWPITSVPRRLDAASWPRHNDNTRSRWQR